LRSFRDGAADWQVRAILLKLQPEGELPGDVTAIRRTIK